MANFTNEGEVYVNEIIFEGSTSGDLYLRLFTNDVDPSAEASVLADLTECTGSGYGPITLTDGNWSGGNPTSYAEQTFKATADDWSDIYGYYIATSSDDTGKLLTGEQFSNAPVSVGDNDEISITPQITSD